MESLKWIERSEIVAKTIGETVVISANKEGLMSLANHLERLAEDVTAGAHLHLDEYNSLEEGSVELVIEKI